MMKTLNPPTPARVYSHMCNDSDPKKAPAARCEPASWQRVSVAQGWGSTFIPSPGLPAAAGRAAEPLGQHRNPPTAGTEIGPKPLVTYPEGKWLCVL